MNTREAAEQHLAALEKCGTAERCGDGLWQIRINPEVSGDE